MLILSRSDISSLLTVAEVIPLMETAFLAVSSGQGVFPLRTHIPLSSPDAPTSNDAEWHGDGLFMPAWDGGHYLGLKTVTVHPTNPRQELPSVQATYMLVDATQGEPLALMEAGVLTALRTGAAGGLAARVLARPDAHVVALFGAGKQARTQLQAVAAVRTITEVRVVTRTPEHTRPFIAELQPFLNVPLRAVADPAEALAGADLVIAATSSRTPVFPGRLVEPGAHVTGVGSYTASMQEIDADLVCRARVIVDSVAAAQAEAGDLLIPLREGRITADHFSTELGAILSGEANGRQSNEEISFFKSVGLAAQDIVTAAEIVRRARERGVGTEVSLG